ncbi:PspC domain-containing protein [Vagococcus xieshaowenii]|uniref:PspC domain-containing protein n=1 Tax=Vagococcus xieshaowenii TaxID=2562451 RepID=A0A4Z0DD81_9ENTE|nr:PspC domain-containing protein [Vagococcus xieshaowenii]QCA28408.1 PspC domain-containing protein [Vagococcus xieshaowenii]TFZ42836.1 PspC domain-containing protein [Vagococcus xieshaowenii]
MKKRLTKSTDNVVVSGVLGGIGEYLGIDPTVIRVIFLASVLFSFGSPIPLYLILMLVVPTNANKKNTQRNFYGDSSTYYGNGKTQQRPRKEAEKVQEDEWSDF